MQIWSAEITELESLYPSIKGRFLELEKDLEHLIKTDDENVALLYARRCLEIIVTDLCECELKRPRKTEPLKGIIDKLLREEKVPAHIITSMDHLNSLSTYGTHPKEFDPEQVKPVLINLDIILKWYLKYNNIKIKTQTEEKIQVREEAMEEVTKEVKIEQQKKNIRLTKHRLLSGVLITTILIIAAILAYPRLFKRDTLERLRATDEKISIAVMPFQNMTGDDSRNFWQEMIQDNLITSLSNSEELIVRQTESIITLLQHNNVTNYASITPSIARKLSEKLDVNVFVSGSVNQSGTTIRLNAKLTDSRTEEIIKAFQKEGTAENILSLIDTLSSMVRDFLVISKLKNAEQADFVPFASTNSPEAYKFFIYGENERRMWNNEMAAKYYSQAIALDSNFTYAIVMLSFSYINLGIYDQPKSLCINVFNKREIMNTRDRNWINILYSYLFETPAERITYLRQLQKVDNKNPIINFQLGYAYSCLLQNVNAIREYENALKIYDDWDTKPYWIKNYTNLGYLYHLTGEYRKEKKLYKKAEKDFPSNRSLFPWQAILALSTGKTKAADEYIEKYKYILNSNSDPEADIITNVANIYWKADVLDKAEEYFREALSLEPEALLRMNQLAYFLIDTDRDINEGMALVDSVLKSNSDNYNYLYTKGWGLYKQGKYQEALDILQKSWDLRRKYAEYDHNAFLRLEAAKKAIANQKNNS